MAIRLLRKTERNVNVKLTLLLSEGLMNVTSARVSKILFGPLASRIWLMRRLDSRAKKTNTANEQKHAEQSSEHVVKENYGVEPDFTGCSK